MFWKLRRIKIVIILGFVIDCGNILEKIIVVGVNMICMNFFYGVLEDYIECVNKVCEIVVKLGKIVVILGDL